MSFKEWFNKPWNPLAILLALIVAGIRMVVEKLGKGGQSR